MDGDLKAISEAIERTQGSMHHLIALMLQLTGVEAVVTFLRFAADDLEALAKAQGKWDPQAMEALREVQQQHLANRKANAAAKSSEGNESNRPH